MPKRSVQTWRDCYRSKRVGNAVLDGAGERLPLQLIKDATEGSNDMSGQMVASC